MARQLFGTDGVRGRAGEFLTAELALAIARTAAARSPRTPDQRPGCSIVRDTRESGEMLEAAIAAGVTAAGGDALLAGVLPTPAAPLLVRRHGLHDGGGHLGVAQPLRGQRHQAVRRRRLQARRRHRARDRGRAGQPVPPSDGPPRSVASDQLHGALEDYLRELHTRFQALDLSGRRVLLDCANGATFRGRAGDLPPARRRRRGHGRPARRAQHQRRAAARRTWRACRAALARRRPRTRLRVRRRRRPRAGGRR